MLSSNMFGVNETNDTHKLLLTDRNVLSFCKSFANNPSTNMKISKWNCTYTIPQECTLNIRIKSISISSRHMNTWEDSWFKKQQH